MSKKGEEMAGAGAMKVLAPAKVNLLLKVLGKRPDQYHELVSVVDIVSLYDTIFIGDDVSEKVTVSDDRQILPVGRDNTIYRAAMLLKDVSGIEKGVRIFVEKGIPIGSGLGGPSSDAAAVLKALVKHWNLPIPFEELMVLGARIGADVPLFLYGKSCVMRGIGEDVSPIKLPRLWYVIVYPDVIISTQEVYMGLRISLTKETNDIKLRSGFDTTAEIAALLENDLERVAIPMCPKIQVIKDRLSEAGAAGVLMSGSGSSVFGLFETEEEAIKASVFVEDLGSVFVTQSV